MIRRTLLLVISPLILVLLFLLLLGEILNQVKGTEIATVFFKPGLVEGDKREGELTRKEKYVVVKSDLGEEVFTWDQVRYISPKDKASSSRRVDQLIDLIELVSKLGIAASVIVFLMGLYQYDQGQKWKREEFLASTVKEFIERPSVRNAMQMLDSLALYPNGRDIRLYPDAEKSADRSVPVSHDEIYKALTTKPDSSLDDKAKAIRDCFDGFLSYLIGFYHYLEQGLITKQGLRSHIGYWIDLLGPGVDLECIYKRRVFAYADRYKFYQVELLIQAYYKEFNWKELPCQEADAADTPQPNLSDPVDNANEPVS